MLRLRDRFMYRIVRPLVGRMPAGLYAWVARGVAVLWGFWMGTRNWRFLSRCLALLGRSTGALSVLRYAMGVAYQRLRHLDYYCQDRPPRVRFDWHEGVTEPERCIYVVCNMIGSEMMREFCDRYPSEAIRTLFGGEGKLPPPELAPAGEKWQAHQAARRFDACLGRLIEVGHAMAYRRLRDDPRSIVIYQDVWDGTDRGPHYPLLGRPTALHLGAIRLSKAGGGLAIRFVSIEPVGGTWVFTIGPRLPSGEGAADALARRVDQEIRRRPEAWLMWWEFLEYQDAREADHWRGLVKKDSGTAMTLSNGASLP